jgi:two-component system CheB/CheR fusion protein
MTANAEKLQVDDRPVIHIIEDDAAVREAGRCLFEAEGWDVQDHSSAEEFLAGPRPSRDACLVIDIALPGMTGLSLLEVLRQEKSSVPAVMLTGRRDAAAAVAALKTGADDFIEKPADPAALVTSVSRALERARDLRVREDVRIQAKARIDKLTPRQLDVMMKIMDGELNKNIAADLGISERTVESHRARVMRKTGAPSLARLIQLYLEANASA